MNYDDTLDIAVGMSFRTKVWKNKKFTWSKLVERLSEENKTTESFKEFLAASKADQGKIKDVGGYVGGYLRNGRRNPKNVVHRQLITLDIDFAHMDFWDDFLLQFNNAALLHSTHKHSEKNPRFRLIMPASREMTPDEYVAVSRKIAGVMGIDLFDSTTFEVNRLMFWPSNPKDTEYYVCFQDGPFIDVDEILDTYNDWTDSSLWPTSEKQLTDLTAHIGKQEDPENKKGIVGAFCRTYSISQAIEKFLPKLYIKLDDTRYTYTNGSTAGGLVTYNDKFSFSHHGTDPTSGRLCNAFDLIRLHRFGHLDDENQRDGRTSKSFKNMEEFARNVSEVKNVIASEKLKESKYDFADGEEEPLEDDIEWMQDLEVDAKSKYLSTASNINIIFANDKRLKGLFKQNDFDTKKYVFDHLPWRRVPKPEVVKNVDYSGVRNYIETIYGITGNLKIEDAMMLEFEKNSFHPIKDYLHELQWDGEKRLDNLLIDYFGAENNIYSKEAIRKVLVGAVARIMKPGVKFDYVLTLVGEQGTGKSTFIKKLAQEWFSDTFMTVHGKEALEQIQGAWIIEMAELSGLRKAEVEAVKHFITKQEDTFRPAYARSSETYLRQCIFVGTTNNKDFLRDPSGNRRFIPVDVVVGDIKKDVFVDLVESEVNMIWAEAFEVYKQGEDLFMSTKANILAKSEQKKHSENDERVGIIEDYLNTKLPEDWNTMDIFQRRIYLEDPLSQKGTIERDYVCVAEVWCECLCKSKEDMDRYKTRDINDILRSLEEWEQFKSTKNFGLYGKQKYYARKLL